MINLAGILIWWGVNRPVPAWTTALCISIVEANVLSLAVGSIVWSLVGFFAAVRSSGSLAVSRIGDFPLGYGRRALVAGSLLLGTVVVCALGGNLLQVPLISVRRLDWIAWAGMTAAAAVLLWNRSPRLALQALYGLAMAWLGMARVGAGAGVSRARVDRHARTGRARSGRRGGRLAAAAVRAAGPHVADSGRAGKCRPTLPIPSGLWQRNGSWLACGPAGRMDFLPRRL